MFISKTSSFFKVFLKNYITNRIVIERPFQWCKSHSSISSGLATVGKRRHGCMSKNSFWLHEYRGVGVDGICENHSDFLYLFTVPYFHHIMVDPRSAWRFIEVMDIWPPLIGMLLGSIQGPRLGRFQLRDMTSLSECGIFWYSMFLYKKIQKKFVNCGKISLSEHLCSIQGPNRGII